MFKKIIFIAFFFNFINIRCSEAKQRKAPTETHKLFSGEIVYQDPMKIFQELERIASECNINLLKELYDLCYEHNTDNKFPIEFNTKNSSQNLIKLICGSFLTDSTFQISAETCKIILHCIVIRKKFCCCYSVYFRNPITGQIYDDEDDPLEQVH